MVNACFSFVRLSRFDFKTETIWNRKFNISQHYDYIVSLCQNDVGVCFVEFRQFRINFFSEISKFRLFKFTISRDFRLLYPCKKIET